MIPDTEKDIVVSIKTLAEDSAYYTNIFKKTERVVSVCFYILSFIPEGGRGEVHARAMSSRASAVYNLVLESLSWTEPGLRERLLGVQAQLVGLLGVVHIATAARVLTRELESVITAELDLVVRYLRNHYLVTDTSATNVVPASRQTERPAAPRPARVANRVTIPKGDISSDAHLVYSRLTDRGERIKTVLEAKPEATIRDIAEVITDVSEKTIQRELNSLIDKGQVMRQGERRWSKYSVVSKV